MELGELITTLEGYDSNLLIPHGFGRPHSYRGYYDELAFEPVNNVTVAQMLDDARESVGKTFHGYKGGEYTMSEHTDVWLASCGCLGDTLGSRLLGYMLAAGSVPAPAAEPTPEQAAADLVRNALAKLLDDWQPEHEYYRDRAARKGYTHDETAAEIYGAAIGRVTEIVAMFTDGPKPPAPAAELTEAQRLAEQVIRIRARTHDGNASAAVVAKGLPRDQFRALLDEVRDLIERATVTVTWAQDGEQTEGDQ